MEQPHGFVKEGGFACRLNRALYGLKQAPREWHATLTDYIIDMGYKRVDEDHSVYIHHNGIIVAIYVDDLLLIGPSISDINLLKVELSHRFRIKDLGPINFYLDMHVVRDRPNRTISVHQSAYIRRVIEAVGMTDCKSVKTPMEVKYLVLSSKATRSCLKFARFTDHSVGQIGNSSVRDGAGCCLRDPSPELELEGLTGG